MRLTEKSPRGDALYECDACRIVGKEGTILLLEEKGRHLCFSCWYERDLRPRREKSVLVEV